MAHVTFSLTHEFILLQFEPGPSPISLSAYTPLLVMILLTALAAAAKRSSAATGSGWIDARLHGIFPRGLLDGEVL